MPLTLASVDVEHRLMSVLLQLGLIIIVARIFAMIFRKLGQPSVIGEVIAGLALGPSLFGYFFPEVSSAVFTKNTAEVFNIISQLGLVFLLFIVGMEFEFSHLKSRGRSAFLISAMGIILPFLLGWQLGEWMYPRLKHEAPANERGFLMFMGVSMSITAMPVLARIMLELNITRTRIGAITITAAAMDDAAGWILLATVSALVRAQFDTLHTILMIAETLAFAALMIFVLRPLLVRAVRYAMRDGELSMNAMAALLVVLFGVAISTSLIGIFAIFGAFLLGAVLSDQHEFREKVRAKMGGFVTVFFLPIFFTYTGLRTDISTLNMSGLWLMAVLICLVAIIGKFGGCMLAAKLGGFTLKESALIGAMMNTRGLMELVVINAGYDLHVIPRSVFCMLVLMAVVTTMMTSPILLALRHRTELEPFIRQSGFVADNAI